MAITTRPPQTPVIPRSVADAPHRGRKRLVVALAAVVVVAALGAFVWLHNYQPLALGSGSYGVWPHSEIVNSFDAYGPDGDFRQTYVRWEVGRTIHMQFPLWNEGRVPVTIDGVTGDQLDRTGPVNVRIVGIGPVVGEHAGGMVQAFYPITLAPHEGVQLFVDVTMRKPVPAAANSTVDTVQLSYATLFVHHTVTMPMGQTLFLCGGVCPP